MPAYGSGRWGVLLPLLLPAIVASSLLVFALSMDNFVVTQYLSADQSSATIPMYLYSDSRVAATPALNALASMMVLFTLIALGVALTVHRLGARRLPGPAA